MNPGQDGAAASAGAMTVVILGASGDLAKKKTVGLHLVPFCCRGGDADNFWHREQYPALFKLFQKQNLPENVKIVGYARTKMNEDDFHRRISAHIKSDSDGEVEKSLEAFYKINSYVSGQYDTEEGFHKLCEHLKSVEGDSSRRNRLFYMALPPSVFIPVAQNLRKLVYPSQGMVRLIVEKPFGKDLESSRKLQCSLEAANWSEEEIYRIDHYLGKEMVKNLLVLRLGNELLASNWSREHIANVQIVLKEPFGTEGRVGYFDDFGIIRDVMQNHLLQILTIIAMEKPKTFMAECIRDQKVRVLECIRPIELKDVITGQYVRSDNGKKPGYLDDEFVPKNSTCPTYAALTMFVDNDRWKDVPFILQAGKALDCQLNEIRIQYKNVDGDVYGHTLARNELVIRIQPDEAVYLKLNTKIPGFSMKTTLANLELSYKTEFPDTLLPDAYESLLLDILKGNHINFVRDDELDASWKIFTPLLHYLEGANGPVPLPYPYGSEGPIKLGEYLANYGL